MPSRRLAVLALLGCGLALLGARGGRVVQVHRTLPGYAEPHTPGSGDALEMAPTQAVIDLLGPSPDLNRVSLVRTYRAIRGLRGKRAQPAKVIVILIPGFLGGATTFDPIARHLVRAFGRGLEVWAVDRRPNVLEDRLGAVHAAQGAARGDLDAITEGAQFYFPDQDLPPTGNFPGVEDFDVDQDGQLDPALPLTDRFGVARAPILLGQDDARFMAHWGVDTYARDWRELVLRARKRVGRKGLVLLGGHSQGTTWATLFAAYDFDPGPGVEPGHQLIDGLILLEGGGVGPPSSNLPTRFAYGVIRNGLARTGSSADVFLSDFQGIPLQGLGTSGEVSAVAAFYRPDEPALIQRTPVFGSGLLGLLLAAPATNRSVVGFFLDDDFEPFTAFRASLGFSDDGPNVLFDVPGFAPAYIASARPDGGLRTWREYDDPGLPTCPPNAFDPAMDGGSGCALLDNGFPSAAGDPPATNGVEREVTDIDDFLRTQFGKSNGFEWYFVSGRVDLDFRFGNDSSSLADDSVLAITQNAGVDVPVLGIGGSNGLTPEAKSFDRYFDSIATPADQKTAVILEGYAHLDVINARNNEAVPAILEFIRDIRARARATGRRRP